jgi:spermidine dehydrogenase
MSENDDLNNQSTAQGRIKQRLEDEKLGFGAPMTRRDFVGSTVLGTGAALLGMAAPSVMRSASAQTPGLSMTGLGPEWTGPGGIGDYSRSNGNTADVVNAAHAGIRNQDQDKFLSGASDTGETFEVIVVGGGVSGLAAMYSYHKERPHAKILNLENHPIFGGESRRNEFEIDGVRLYGPQGPQEFQTMNTPEDMFPLNAELGFPNVFQWTEPTGLATKNLRMATNIYESSDDSTADVGYFYGSKGWVRNPSSNGFKDAPISESLKRELMYLQSVDKPPYRPEGDLSKWLDSMSYLDLLTKYFKVSPEVAPYIDGLLATGMIGLGADMASAYLAVANDLPGARAYSGECDAWKILGLKYPFYSTPNLIGVSAPGGNAVVARTLVQKMIPSVFNGTTWTDIWLAPIHWEALDRPNQPVRIQVNSTVVAVAHDGPPQSAKGVVVWYVNGGTLYKARAKAVIMATSQQVNRHVCRDVPADYREAMSTFHHAPALVVNVGVRHWRFMDKLGITGARWFSDFGWHTGLHKNIQVDGKDIMPCDPNKPAVMETYVTFPIRGMPFPQQATAARMRMFALSYADIEKAIRRQFNEMFASAGFDAKRDIGAIIANRHGHAMPVMGPGFYFGKDGKPAPKEILKNRFGRIAFCHSELMGEQVWSTAAISGQRAARQMLDVL